MGTEFAALALWVLTTRRRLRKDLDVLRHELRVTNGAAYNVGELVVRLRASAPGAGYDQASAVNHGIEPVAGQAGTIAEQAPYEIDQSELSVSETQLLDRLREAHVH